MEPSYTYFVGLKGDEMKSREAAKIAYNAYRANTGGKTWDGKDMPTWEVVQDRDRGKSTGVTYNWEAACRTLAQALGTPID